MHWQLVTALMLFVAWSYPIQTQSARTPALELQQRLPQAMHPANRDNYQYVLLPNTRGGYRRRSVHGLGKAAPTTTTERPLVRVWNSFIRSVQPSFSLRNLTNPLANFFNDGSTNIIETSPVFLQSLDEDLDPKPEDPTPEVQSSKKRKRKHRKQQKRRPAYDSQEYDDSYDYYAPPLPPAQPMFFYDTNSGSYYGVQRFSPEDFQTNYYNRFDPSSEREPQEPTILGKINTKKITLLRPLPLSAAGTVDASDSANQNEDVFDENNLNDNTALTDSTSYGIAEDDDDATSHSPLSKSMRNALGTYMRDDQRNRQRQRQSERNGGVTAVSEAGAKVSPRHRNRYFLAARLVN
ncbi:uncharacterized protein LOC111065526 [Drosophila obscura]|uniref:uncharacterized protein LOC111065526 n=1 Tax=Drosophila obscura TaxID=7282 RepID=UPI001BB0E052|nr:uncharacterized protein LOC111065526 [Drosophila obscura]